MTLDMGTGTISRELKEQRYFMALKDPSSSRNLLQIEYWKSFNKATKGLRKREPISERKDERLGWPFGGPRNHLSIAANQEDTYVFFQIEKERHPSLFQTLKDRREEIENALGFELIWRERPDDPRSYIETERYPLGLNTPEHWPEAFSWTLAKLYALERVFGPIVSTPN